jgi:hypothetical protein
MTSRHRHRLQLGTVRTRDLNYPDMPSAARAPLPKGLGLELAGRTYSTLSRGFGRRNLTTPDYIGKVCPSYYDTGADSQYSCPMSALDKFSLSLTPMEVHLDF